MNSALRSLVPAKARRWVFIGGAVLLLLASMAAFFGGPGAIMAALLVGLACIAALAATWAIIWYVMKRGRRSRQRQFDAGIAAREGIDDRKREWQSWVDELEKNEIDRYDLPFYLLVGEPQSGKSVLLQNSDLKFLFGQSRLSGIGGTRGCDWWFTEEAVILDLAGRLFTHEGGAADEAEWEAFLDLLNTFRPLDPANGIMLVIPCDGLLGESLETCGHKASKTREALLSLTRKLEAKLPIYVVLTKGDKIFGFAETVHRLPIEQRHQMFGWSRTAERLEEPFEPAELREAWDGIVRRGTVVRDRMLATARLPEALPEVDRMLGFPAELEGLYEPLETYLNRIFQGSDLVEQLYFRGIYLTSGLQSGAPIAKVCLDILDRPGEADNRDLEKLFVRQQSYFIKDLVRKRVFAERGLVKPTSARVERAKKTAWTGYGVAASLAVISLIWGAAEIRSNFKQSGQDKYDEAIASASRWTPDELEKLKRQDSEQPKISSLLDTLEEIDGAYEQKPTYMQRLHASRRPSFRSLYATIYDDVYRDRLQSLAARQLQAAARDYTPGDITQRPADHAAFLAQARAAAALVDGIADPASARTIAAVLDDDLDLDRVEKAHQRRGDDFEPDGSASRPDTLSAIARINELWDATLDPADPIHIDGSVGFCLAWYGMTLFEAGTKRADQEMTAGAAPDRGMFSECARANRMLAFLADYTANTSFEVATLPIGDFQRDNHALTTLRAELLSVNGQVAPPWTAKKDFVTWMRRNDLGLEKLLADRRSSIPRENLAPVLNGYLASTDLMLICRTDWLGESCADAPIELAAELRKGIELLESDDALLRSVAHVKLRLAQESFIETYGDWVKLHDKLLSGDADGLEKRVETQLAVLELLASLEGAPTDMNKLERHLETMATAGVSALDGSLGTSRLESAGIAVLIRTRSVAGAAPACEQAIRTHLDGVREALDTRWTGLTEAWDRDHATPDAPTIAAEAVEHLREIKRLLPAADDAGFDDGRPAWEEKTRSRLNQRLSVYAKRIETAIEARVDMTDVADLAEACNRVSGVLVGGSQHSKLNDWTSKLHAELSVPLARDASLEAFYALVPTDKQVTFDDYVRTAQLGTWPAADDPQERVRRHVLRFLDGTEAIDGPDLAERYYETKLDLPPLNDPDSPQHGVYLDFSRALNRSFDAAVVRQLRRDYLNDLGEKIARDSASELGAFWQDRTTDGSKKGRHHEAVDHLFGDQGLYLLLLENYRVLANPKDDFRIDVETLVASDDITDSPRQRWQLDIFLEEMLLYVRGAVELEQLEGQNRPSHPLTDLEAFEISFDAFAPSAQAYEETWNHWDAFESSLFTPDGRTSIQRDPDGRIIVTKPKLGWGFHEGKAFDLKWRDRVAGATGQWMTYERNSCLEPLLLFWSDMRTWAQEEIKAQEKTARVDFQVTLDERAPFELTIKPAPPRRPSLDLQTLFKD